MGDSTVRPFGKDFGLIHEVVVTGRRSEVGADENFWKALAHDPGAFRAAVQAVRDSQQSRQEGLGLSVTAVRNRMGADVKSSGPVRDCFGRGLSFGDVMRQYTGFTIDQLEDREGLYLHGLFAMQLIAPLSLLELYGKYPDFFGSSKKEWLGDPQQTFAHTRPEVRWLLVRETTGATGLGWDGQAGMLYATEFVPSASILVQVHLLHYVMTGKGLLSGVSYTSDTFIKDVSHGRPRPRMVAVFREDSVQIVPEDDVDPNLIGIIPAVAPVN